MLTLGQATTATPDTGAALPQPWGNLRQRGVQFRRGELHMLAARPGQGKSAFALATALRMNVPTLYLCPDTTARTQVMRLLAQTEQRPMWEIEREYDENPNDCNERARQAHPQLMWAFDVESLSDIDSEVMAWQEVWGDPPSLIIVDNLIDISSLDGDEWGSSRKTLRELKGLAKELSCAVLVLHHVSESYETKREGAPASRDILGKDNRLAALVLTMNIAGGIAGMAAVKNRYGQSDPNAENMVGFRFDAPRMTFEESFTGSWENSK